MSVPVELTRLLSYRVAGDEAVDAIGMVAGEASAEPGAAGAPVRVFVPGFLPCGECPLCRRSLVGACRAPTRPLAGLTPPVTVAAERRFLTPVDEPPGVTPLADEVAIRAGAVAFALHAHALASLAPGDVAVWIGAEALAAIGAAVATASGAHALAAADATADTIRARLAATTADPNVAHGAQKQLLFLAEPTPTSWQLAAAIADPGATIVALGAPALPALPVPRETRLFTLSAYHPDFIAEALATLRRDPGVTAAATAVAAT